MLCFGNPETIATAFVIDCNLDTSLQKGN
jgi:hypothetical protein